MDNNKHTFIVEHFDRQIARQNEEMKRNLIRAADEVARLIEQLNNGRTVAPCEIGNAIHRLQEAEAARIKAVSMNEVLQALR